MPTCVPIKDMRDTARFSQLVESASGPVTVTKNGYEKFVVMRSEDYDLLMEQCGRADLLARVAVAERERADGLGRNAFESLAAIRERHGL